MNIFCSNLFSLSCFSISLFYFIIFLVNNFLIYNFYKNIFLTKIYGRWKMIKMKKEKRNMKKKKVETDGRKHRFFSLDWITECIFSSFINGQFFWQTSVCHVFSCSYHFQDKAIAYKKTNLLMWLTIGHLLFYYFMCHTRACGWNCHWWIKILKSSSEGNLEAASSFSSTNSKGM